MPESRRRLELFEQLEGRFASRAGMVILITGLPGPCMLEYLNSGNRYLQLQFWRIHLMTLIRVVFTFVLFILQPLLLHRRFREKP
jgi:hypothetical protein